MIGSNGIAAIAQQVQLASSMGAKVEALVQRPDCTLQQTRNLLAEIARIVEAQKQAMARLDLDPSEPAHEICLKLERHLLELAETLFAKMASLQNVELDA